MSPYFNTTGLTGSELKKAKRSANTQEVRILRFFRKNPSRGFSPEDVQTFCQLTNRPLTSTRRALSNLTADGFLRKTNSMKRGKFGAKIHTWTLAEGCNQQIEISI